jgi:hypothetical protein
MQGLLLSNVDAAAAQISQVTTTVELESRTTAAEAAEAEKEFGEKTKETEREEKMQGRHQVSKDCFRALQRTWVGLQLKMYFLISCRKVRILKFKKCTKK